MPLGRRGLVGPPPRRDHRHIRLPRAEDQRDHPHRGGGRAAKGGAAAAARAPPLPDDDARARPRERPLRRRGLAGMAGRKRRPGRRGRLHLPHEAGQRRLRPCLQGGAPEVRRLRCQGPPEEEHVPRQRLHRAQPRALLPPLRGAAPEHHPGLRRLACHPQPLRHHGLRRRAALAEVRQGDLGGLGRQDAAEGHGAELRLPGGLGGGAPPQPARLPPRPQARQLDRLRRRRHAPFGRFRPRDAALRAIAPVAPKLRLLAIRCPGGFPQRVP
mmetsp:Transcript_122613/g.352255  ORF Transcript_122613/g.352255 Transcript_122613/m.352255 type:complete len:271 (+) Transcript_122613:507-1319(+)